MVIETKQRAAETAYALTAENVMDGNCLIIPKHMLVSEAARLLHRKRSGLAAVVDENGRCTGMLRPADVFRWIEAGCPKAIVGTPVTCPNQVNGRMLNGDEAVICTLAHGSCAFQDEQPTTGGRHTDVCARQDTADLPFGATPRYMMADFVGVGSRSTLVEMVLALVNSRADGLIVLDEFDRPVGIVTAIDILAAVVDSMRELTDAAKERRVARRPK